MSKAITFTETPTEEEEDAFNFSSDGDEEEEEDAKSSSEEEEEENKEEEDISFESDDEEEEEDVLEEEEDGDGGIDIAEFYDDGPKSSRSKFALKCRKRTNPPKVAKQRRKKHSNMGDNIIMDYSCDDYREKISKIINELSVTSKESKNIERLIYNSIIRKLTFDLKRPLKKLDLNNDVFGKEYLLLSYEILSRMSVCSYGEIIIFFESSESKTRLNSDEFKDQIFNDKRETNNIENPPKVMTGIHTCSVCIKDKDREQDTDRGKRIDWYQQQTRSCDEPMTTFLRCLDCGKKWKF